jgi:hypothetical protein
LGIRLQVFLFTDKEETPAVFNALAANMRNYKYIFADVHSSQEEVMEKFGVEKVRNSAHRNLPQHIAVD